MIFKSNPRGSNSSNYNLLHLQLWFLFIYLKTMEFLYPRLYANLKCACKIIGPLQAWNSWHGFEPMYFKWERYFSISLSRWTSLITQLMKHSFSRNIAVSGGNHLLLGEAPLIKSKYSNKCRPCILTTFLSKLIIESRTNS